MLLSTLLTRIRVLTLAAGSTALVGVAACNNVGEPNASAARSLADAAFGLPVLGYNEVTSSFAGVGGAPFAGEFGRGPGRDARDGGPGLGFMGGGFGDGFAGGAGEGRGNERGPFRSGIDSTCTFASGTGAVTCGPNTRDGLTVTRVYNFTTAAGVAQSRPDSLTNVERSTITVDGTTIRFRRDSITTTVRNRSERLVTGIASTATQRTVNGISTGNEQSSGVNRDGVSFTSTRVSGDTTSGLIIPVVASGQSYPTAGTVTRMMIVTTTVAGAAPVTNTRREVITYNGSATATVVVTRNGTTSTCSLPLPRGRLSCP